MAMSTNSFCQNQIPTNGLDARAQKLVQEHLGKVATIFSSRYIEN